MAKYKKRAVVQLLTDREIEVLKLICDEKSSIKIGKEIGISARTVDAHRANMILKLGVRNIVGLVKYAVKEGIVLP